MVVFSSHSASARLCCRRWRERLTQRRTEVIPTKTRLRVVKHFLASQLAPPTQHSVLAPSLVSQPASPTRPPAFKRSLITRLNLTLPLVIEHCLGTQRASRIPPAVLKRLLTT